MIARPGQSLISAGVPALTIPYGTDVATYWATHPYNIGAPGYYYQTITSPATVFDVDATYAGNLQSALDAMTASGGTLKLGNGPYALADVTGKSNIHFIGNGATVLRGVRIFGATIAQTYFGASNNGWVNGIWAADATALAVFASRPSNFLFKDCIFDGNAVVVTVNDETPDNTAFFGRAIKDVLFYRCKFQNYDSSASTWHPGLISANGLCDNIWALYCTFSGASKHAFFADGLHGGGTVHCSFSSTIADKRVLQFTNNDVTYPYSGGASMLNREIRDTQYCVHANNSYALSGSAPSTMIEIHGGNNLVIANTITGTPTPTQFVQIKVHCYNPASAALITSGQYRSYGNKILNNTLVNATYGVTFDGVSGGDPSGVTTCLVGNYGLVGQATITGNTASSITAWTNEIAPVTANTVSGNTP